MVLSAVVALAVADSMVSHSIEALLRARYG
jgi:hypothetical protein